MREYYLCELADINPKNDTIKEKFIYIDLESVNQGILCQKTLVTRNCAPSRAQRTVKLNDILYQTVRPYQKNNYIMKEYFEYQVVASTGYALIRPKINPLYLYYLLHSKKFNDEVINRCTGTSFPAIASNDLKVIKCRIHNEELQKKIGIILYLLDKRIYSQKKIINNLCSLINGIINEFFSEKGLYKEGRLVPLKDILLEGNKVSVDTKAYQKITVKLNKEGIVFSNITREMSDTRPFYLREKGELIIGKQNYFNGSIAVISEEYDKTICSNAIMSFKIKDSYNKDFIYHCISNDLFLKYRSHLANGTGQKELSEKVFLTFVIRLPDQSIQENIVKKIDLVTHKLNTEKKILFLYEKQKQYLLDKLFI